VTAPSHWLPRRYLFRVGRWNVPSYTLMLYVGCVLGVYAGAAVAGANGLPVARVVVVSVILVVPALVGSRLLYVAQHADVYRADPSRLWRRRDGGAALFGGLVLALAVSVPLLRALDLPFLGYWDCGALTMAVGNVFTRVGCHLNCCCAGRATTGRLGIELPDQAGARKRRIPAQLLEAAWVVVTIGAALAVGRAVDEEGAEFAVVIALYGAGRALLERAREPDHGRAASPVNLWVAGGLTLVGVAVLAVVASG
jgi:prolipoprotein diacylglyceryltransferase